MITIIDGDFTKAQQEVIIHCCNCFHKMGSGAAKAIRETFPEAYKADLSTSCGDFSKLGTWSQARSKGKLILNVYGQFKYGHNQRYTSYDALDTAFLGINKWLASWPIRPSVAMPMKIGCNLGGGNWNIVGKIITESFTDIDVFLYQLK